MPPYPAVRRKTAHSRRTHIPSERQMPAARSPKRAAARFRRQTAAPSMHRAAVATEKNRADIPDRLPVTVRERTGRRSRARTPPLLAVPWHAPPEPPPSPPAADRAPGAKRAADSDPAAPRAIRQTAGRMRKAQASTVLRPLPAPVSACAGGSCGASALPADGVGPRVAIPSVSAAVTCAP